MAYGHVSQVCTEMESARKAVDPKPSYMTFDIRVQPYRVIYGKDKTRRTLRSVPELFRAAQSNELCPGANAIFALFFGERVGGFSVVGGGIRPDPEDVDGTPSLDEDVGTPSNEDEVPVVRLRDDGTGGGGISALSVRILGTGALFDCDWDDNDVRWVDWLATRWALPIAGKAGGASSLGSSSSSESLSLKPSSSSSECGGEMLSKAFVEGRP